MSYTTSLTSLTQGRIYVATEYPTFLKIMSDVSQNLRILCQIILNRRQMCLFWCEISQFYGITYKFFNYSAPYCKVSKIQHPTSRVVGTLNYAPALTSSKIKLFCCVHIFFADSKNNKELRILPSKLDDFEKHNIS